MLSVSEANIGLQRYTLSTLSLQQMVRRMSVLSPTHFSEWKSGVPH
jgi:hypothetical protein